MIDSKKPEGEYSGLNVSYYVVNIPYPKRQQPYTAECEDIAEALNMTFHEYNAFKAVWRSAAHRTLGLTKRGADENGIYDAEKVAHAGQRMMAMRQLAAGFKPARGDAVEQLAKASAKLRQLGYYPDRQGEWQSVKQDLAERVPALDRRSK